MRANRAADDDRLPGPGARVLRYGPDAVLVEVGTLDEVRALDGAIRRARADDDALAAIVDQVPAARSVLVRVGRRGDVEKLARRIERLVREPLEADDARPHDEAGVVELPVSYDGPDLDDVARLLAMPREEVAARHSAGHYVVAFGGFMPGFAYLVGLDDALRAPRLPSPRERVPAGSVAIADTFTAVYPAPTPGGWRLIGTCPTTLFDLTREPAALLVPGTRVRFVEAGE